MGNFSKDPNDVLTKALDKNYASVLIQQGVPVLDRDLNLLSDLAHNSIRELNKKYIGNGVPTSSDGFRISLIPDDKNNFNISEGTILANGFLISLDEDTTYRDQPIKDGLVSELPKKFDVFLRVWEEEIGPNDDPALNNDEDVGMPTSVRRKVLWQVVVYEHDVIVPRGLVVLATIDNSIGPLHRPPVSDKRIRNLTLQTLAQEIHVKDGKVGIGTPDPQYGRLMIEDHAVPLSFRETGVAVDQGGLWRMPLDGGKLRFDVNTGNEGHEFGSNYRSLLTMTKDGNTGIRMPNPAEALTVGAGNVLLPTANLEFDGNLYFGGITNKGEIGLRLFGGNVNENFPAGFIDVKTTDDNDGLRIRVDKDKAETERMRITAKGTVVIGTMIPIPSPLSYMLLVTGRCYSLGGWHTPPADYAEYFESDSVSAIPVATSVTVTKDGKVRPAKKGEIPIGIVCINSALVGNSFIEWPKKYLRDEFRNLILEKYEEEVMVRKKEKVTRERQKTEKKTIKEMVTRTKIVLEKGKYCQEEKTETVTREVEELLFEEVDLYDATGKNLIGKHRVPVMETYEEEIEVFDENGQPVLVGSGEFVTKQRPKLNPEYDESRKYVPREDRPEWNCVGLLGQLPMRKGQPVADSWFKIRDISDDVELWLVK